MHTKNLGKLIFSKILQMPLRKYLAFIEQAIPHRGTTAGKLPIIYANLLVRAGAIIPEILDARLQRRYSAPGSPDTKVAYAVRWINTRNALAQHILQSLLTYQREYFCSGEDVDLKPLTFQEFLARFPCPYLDQSRFSRLVGTLLVRTPQDEIISLRNVCVSRKRWYAYHVKHVVDASAASGDQALTDPEIQAALLKKGMRLTVRTICNYRRLLNIPRYQARAAHYYGREVAFSDHKMVAEKKSDTLPAEPGVYELSLDAKIAYPKHASAVIYVGSSGNLRKRMATYSGRTFKNTRLKGLVGKGEFFVRYVVSSDYRTLEKTLLKSFKSNYGALPKANTLGEFL